jgi:hypothetical protein
MSLVRVDKMGVGAFRAATDIVCRHEHLTLRDHLVSDEHRSDHEQIR